MWVNAVPLLGLIWKWSERLNLNDLGFVLGESKLCRNTRTLTGHGRFGTTWKHDIEVIKEITLSEVFLLKVCLI